MNRFEMRGNHRVMLHHLAPLGLVSILRHGPDPAATYRWVVDEGAPHVRIVTSLSQDEIAAAVSARATRLSTDSWVTAVIQDGPRAGASLFSPRVKGPTDREDWLRYVDAREAWMHHHRDDMTALDHALIGGLGEPAWWSWSPRESQPDQGASRWEMKTRNRGEEFLANRFLLLARVVQKRGVEVNADGLRGDAIIDENGSGSDSRTGTGLCPPGPVDSAVAFVALHALALMPPIRRLGSVADTPGMLPRGRVHPEFAAVPIFTDSVTPSLFRAVMMTAEFDRLAQACFGLGEAHWEEAEGTALRDRGIRGILACPVRKTGSASAPERQLLAGRVHLL